jgi:polyhydroxybutyrate depolymerase
VAAALAALLSACGNDGEPAGGTGPLAGTRPPTATAAATDAGPVAACPAAGRSTLPGAVLRMPAGARPGATPLLVVVVPGGRGDPGDRLGVGRAGTRAGFGVLYPTSGDGDGFWTLNREQGTADVTEVTATLDRAMAGGCFDAARVSITGVSNGAGFATRMSCEQPGRFAAVLPVAAGFRALDPCPAAARASLLAIHGTADTVVPYDGRRPDRAGSVPRRAARHARRDGCDPAPRTTRPRRLVTRIAYRGCDAGMRVEILRLSGTDHGWPGAGPPRPRHNPSGLDATPEILRFAAAARRPGQPARSR